MAQTAPPAPRGHLVRALSGQVVRPALRPRAPQLRPRLPQRRIAPPIWRELLLIALFYTAYTLTRLVLNSGGTAVAYRHAGDILSFERMFKIDIELGLNQALLDVSWLARSANYFYGIAHFVVTLSILVWIYRYRPEHYRWLRSALMAATAVALVGFWLYPLAPPRFLPGEGFVDPVQALGSWGLYAGQTSGALTNQYAAMPSMHAGWALWCGLILFRLGTQRWAKALGVIYPAMTVLVILATANHYLVDAIVGVAIVVTTLVISLLLYRRRPITFQKSLKRPIVRRNSRPYDSDSPSMGDAPVAPV